MATLKIHPLGQARPAGAMLWAPGGGARGMFPAFVGPAPQAQPWWLQTQSFFPVTGRPVIQSYCPTRCVPPRWVCGSQAGRQRIFGTDADGHPITLPAEFIDPHGNPIPEPPYVPPQYEPPPFATPTTGGYAPPTQTVAPGELPYELDEEVPDLAPASGGGGGVGVLAAIALAMIGVRA